MFPCITAGSNFSKIYHGLLIIPGSHVIPVFPASIGRAGFPIVSVGILGHSELSYILNSATNQLPHFTYNFLSGAQT
jgi:hypothetical protein